MAGHGKTSALEFAAATHPGQVRELNEDSVLVDAQHGFALLADGMGGYNAGEVASKLAVDMLGDSLKSRLSMVLGGGRREDIGAHEGIGILLQLLIGQANSTIYQRSMSQTKLRGMGTTLVAAVYHDNRLVYSHVGDSRLYRLRGKTLQRLTRDHTELQANLDSGALTAEAAAASTKGKLTRALGAAAVVPVDIQQTDVLPGDVFLLCSDGLSDLVAGNEIGWALASGMAPEAIAQRLVNMANAKGGPDNISVVVARVRQASPA